MQCTMMTRRFEAECCVIGLTLNARWIKRKPELKFGTPMLATTSSPPIRELKFSITGQPWHMPPRHFIPHRSGVHRFACFALYRALLRASGPLSSLRPLPKEVKRPTTTPNRLRIIAAFHRNAKLQSTTRIVKQLQRGYDLLPALRSGTIPQDDVSIGPKTYTRSPPSKKRLVTITTPASETPSKDAASPSPIAQSPNTETSKQSTNPNLPLSLQHRPLPLSALSNRKSPHRKVPVFVDGNGIPFLRLKKPQPKALSHRIRKQISWYQQRWSSIHDLENQLNTQIKSEDRWEELLIDEAGYRGDEAGTWGKGNKPKRNGGKQENQSQTGTERTRTRHREGRAESQNHNMPTFSAAVKISIDDEYGRIKAFQERNRERYQALMELLEKEKGLQEVEVREARQVAKARRVEGRRRRREGENEDAELAEEGGRS